MSGTSRYGYQDSGSRTAQARRRQQLERQRRSGIVAVCLALAGCSLLLGLAVAWSVRRQPPPAPAADAAPMQPRTPVAARQDGATHAAPDRAPPPAALPAKPVQDAGAELPWRDDASARHIAGQYQCRTGWFELPTAMPDLPLVRCDWRMPIDAAGRPLPSAADVVAMFPYPQEQCAIEGFGSPLSTRFGFTTLTIRFPRTAPADGIPPDDPKRWYYFPESGSGDAWIAAIGQVRRIGGLPARPVFAFGRSGGGSAAHLFAEAHPELVAAVVQEAGRVHAQQPRHPGPMLLLHGHHDYVAEACISLEGRLRRAGSDIARIGFAPGWGGRGRQVIWSHSATPPAADLMWQWLAGVANLRLGSGRIPPMSQWPAVHGDLRLPDEATRSMLQRLTPDRQLSTIAGARVATARPAPSVAPRALAIVACNRYEASPVQDDLDLLFLADHGVAAIGASADGAAVLPALQLALRREVPSIRALPWILVVDQPDGLGGLLGLSSRPPQAVVLFHADARTLRTAIATCSDRGVPLVVAAARQEIGRLRTAMDSASVVWSSLNDGNDLLQHADRCKAMLAAVDRPPR